MCAHTQSAAGKLYFTLGVQPGVAFPAKPVSKSQHPDFSPGTSNTVFTFISTPLSLEASGGLLGSPGWQKQVSRPLLAPRPHTLLCPGKPEGRAAAVLDSSRAPSRRPGGRRAEVGRAGLALI